MGIGERIREAVEQRGLSYKEAAKKCGISYSSLQNWVTGIREPRAEALIAIGSHLGISIDWLLTGDGSMFRDASSGSISSSVATTPEEDAILGLYRSLSESDRRDIQSAVEEKKRIRDIEQRLDELSIALADIKKPA